METAFKKFQKMGTAQLLAKVDKLVSIEQEAVISILKSRNQDVSKFDKKGVVEFEDETPLSKEDQKLIDQAERELKREEKGKPAKTEKATKAEKAPKSPKVTKEKKEKTPKVKKEAPEPGSISEKILAMLKEGKLTKYAIAKELKTHYPMVQHVEKAYMTTSENITPSTEE